MEYVLGIVQRILCSYILSSPSSCQVTSYILNSLIYHTATTTATATTTTKNKFTWPHAFIRITKYYVCKQCVCKATEVYRALYIKCLKCNYSLCMFIIKTETNTRCNNNHKVLVYYHTPPHLSILNHFFLLDRKLVQMATSRNQCRLEVPRLLQEQQSSASESFYHTIH